MMLGRARILAGCLLAGLRLAAQVGGPVPVRYEIDGTVEPFAPGPIQRIIWGNPGDQWSASFGIPSSRGSSTSGQGASPYLHLEVQAPDGAKQSLSLPLDRSNYASEDVNGEFIGAVEWESPHMTFSGLHDVHYAEQTELGPWEIRRVIWRVGGCSGDPPMLFVLVVRHRESARWVVCQDVYQYPPAPDGGDPMHAKLLVGGALEVSFWNYEGRNSAICSGWTFSADRAGAVQCKPLKPRFCLYTRTGAVATLADTPYEAIHFGYQEVAWHLESWNSRGGVARAFAPSPRRFLTEDDRFGAPILPQEGRRAFQWAAEMYVVPWRGKPVRMSLTEALARIGHGRWDVVLFPLRGEALAQRLVEHQRDFPHSTPK